MKKTFSVSAEEKVIEEFTLVANEFWTNRTNLLSMFMVDVIKNRQIHFNRNTPENNSSFDSFSEDELNDLKNGGKDSFSSICNSLKSI